MIIDVNVTNRHVVWYFQFYFLWNYCGNQHRTLSLPLTHSLALQLQFYIQSIHAICLFTLLHDYLKQAAIRSNTMYFLYIYCINIKSATISCKNYILHIHVSLSKEWSFRVSPVWRSPWCYCIYSTVMCIGLCPPSF